MIGFDEFVDTMDLQGDVSADDTAIPQYATVLSDIPCKVNVTSGDETWRGRQLEGHTAAVIQTHEVEIDLGQPALASMRAVVTEGLRKTTYNVMYPRPVRKPGKPLIMEWYCRDLSD